MRTWGACIKTAGCNPCPGWSKPRDPPINYSNTGGFASKNNPRPAQAPQDLWVRSLVAVGRPKHGPWLLPMRRSETSRILCRLVSLRPLRLQSVMLAEAMALCRITAAILNWWHFERSIGLPVPASNSFTCIYSSSVTLGPNRCLGTIGRSRRVSF